MRRWPLFLLAAVTACGSGAGCPLDGCASQLTVLLPDTATSASACVDGVCATEVVDGGLQVPLNRRAEGSSVEVVVEVVDAAGAATRSVGDAAVVTTRPNGEGCPPTCVTGAVRLDGGGALVDVAPPGPSGS